MELTSIHNVYFIGIGGIGMSALARYFADRGCYVSGYDSTPSAITDRLLEKGISIHFEEDLDRIDARADVVVYTPALHSSHQELTYFRENGYRVMKRSEMLGAITEQMTTVAVAGSHGKTTVSAMISHLLKETGVDCSAFIGGIMTNYNSNYLRGEDNIAVVEADEYDWSFLQLQPDIAVVTAVDTDHLDVYGSQGQVEAAFEQFLGNLKAEGIAIVQAATNLAKKGKVNYYTYALDTPAVDYNIANRNIGEGEYI
jgi:UDP-N-acetylmuramate--alanine ligase